MGSELSLVQVELYKYKKDDTEYGDFLDGELDLTYPNWQECTMDLPESKYEPDIKFTKDCYGFKFDFFGANFDNSHASGLEFEFREGFGGEMFEGFEEGLIEYGEKLIGEYNTIQENMKESNFVKMVRFITLWEYNSWVDSYYNEFDSDWNLLGLVRINESLIDKE